MARDYAIYDVFTEDKLAGNPLAVVFDGTDLSDQRMQAIAGEFNLSETVFILPAENPAHGARLRIFTPGKELPFAGHPTVGAAVALAERQHGAAALDLVTVLEETVGPMRCAVRLVEGRPGFAEFDLPRASEPMPLSLDKQAVADALCISAADIGFENHRLSGWNAGVAYVMVPIADLSVAARIRFDAQRWHATGAGATSLYAYCRGGVDHRASFHARMFAPELGIAEDPATGSAVAAMSGAIRHFDDLAPGHHALTIEQGVEMGRPSLIHLHVEAGRTGIERARIGGAAIKIAEGRILL